MLISIAIENFKSFDKLTSFNMIASNKLRNNKDRVFHADNVSILKSAVIYGANASGKSNLNEAFRFIQHCILSKKIPLKSRQLYCKNKESNENRISTFEIKMYINGVCYAYGFDILLKEQTIVREWVLELTKSDEFKILFSREKGKFELSEELRANNDDMDKFKIYSEDLSENNSVLFLSEMNRNKKITKDSKLFFFKEIYNWFSEDVNIFSPDTPVTNFEYYYDVSSLKIVKHIIKSFDTGISDIKIRELSLEELQNKLNKEIFKDIINKVKEKATNNNINGFRLSMRSKNEFFNIAMDSEDNEPIITTLSFKHGKSLCDFDFDEESDGTRRIFDLLDILLTENKNSVYIIDEMERSLHPSLTKHFIELLNEYHSKSNIQLIFTTHESTIMTQELFRRDQIWFVSRDELNNSNIYPLDRFNERYDKKISKAYLEGRYGAIPIFGSFDIEELI